MNPESTPAEISFALLASGANFSCEVLQALMRKGYSPDLVILPEYPPATSNHGDIVNFEFEPEPARMLQLAPDIEIAYAPEARQTDCAAAIDDRGIDYLLVACWPYRIGSRLIQSAVKAALNLHPSLLPKYRGPDPLQQQLAAGDSRFGSTLHKLDQRFDHGDIVAQAALPDFQTTPTIALLEQYCALLGVELFVDAVSCFAQWRPVAQATCNRVGA